MRYLIISLVIIFISVMIAVLFAMYSIRMRSESYEPDWNNMPVYCINLGDSITRRKNMIHAYMHFPFKLRIVEAVDTRHDKWILYTNKISDRAFYTMFWTIRNNIRPRHMDLSPGAVGCFLSHIKTWKLFQSTGESFALIMEDDSSFPAITFLRDMTEIIRTWPTSCHVVILNYIINGYTVTHGKYKYLSHDAKSSFFLLNCYLLSKEGVEQLLALVEDAEFRIDVQIDAFITQHIHSSDLNVAFWYRNICPQDGRDGTTIQTYGALDF